MIRRRPKWFRRDGTPIRDLLVWARLLENRRYAQVAETFLEDGTRISTVWLGLDYNFMAYLQDLDIMKSPPLIFETMVFSPETETIEFGGKKSEFHKILEQDRYSTEAEAIMGHDAITRKWKAVREAWKNLHPGEQIDTSKPRYDN